MRCSFLGAAQIAGRRPEVDRLDEAAPALAHDHEHLPGVDGDLAGAAGPRQTRLRVVVRTDDRRVDVAEPVDLRRAEKADVDEAALEVVAEQFEHADDRCRASDDRRVADGQWQPRRPRPEHAGLVHELEIGCDCPLREIDGDVRQPDADEADALAGKLPGGRHDHHLGLAEGARARSGARAARRFIGAPRRARSGCRPDRSRGSACRPVRSRCRSET